MNTARLSQYQRSVLLVIAGGIFLSTSGISVRLMEEATGLQIVFYRGLGLAVFMGLVVWRRYQGRVVQPILDLGGIGFTAGLLFTGTSLAIIYALLNTSVANAMFIISLAPLFAALFGWFFLREAVSSRTWKATLLAIIGVVIMVEGGISPQGWLGIVYALAMAVCYGGFTVCLRAAGERDMLPAICLSGILLCVFSALVADSLVLPTTDLLLCLAMGVFQVGMGSLCITLGAHHVPAAQIVLLAMLEVVLNPVWVWLGVGETPGLYSVIGGGLILCAIAYQALNGSGRTLAE